MDQRLPKVSSLNNGVIDCGACGKPLEFNGVEPLTIQSCPHCDAPAFIPKRIRDFWLFLPLGGGGMGSVYKAIDASSSKLLAVKVLPRDMKGSQALVENLYREAEVGYALGTHPKVVSVLDCGEEDGEYFMATEFIEGDRLDVFVEEREKLSEEKMLDVASQILEAESHIAQCGYLFRDLKPQNVIVEANGNVRLFDYGLCLALEEAANPDQEADEIEGSPFFIPPERLVGAPEGEYSELYSLGMLMFYMLDGKNYYKEGKKTEDLVKKHVVGVRMSSVANRFTHCHPSTIKMLDRMLKRQPSERYQTFAEARSDFDNVKRELKRSDRGGEAPAVATMPLGNRMAASAPRSSRRGLLSGKVLAGLAAVVALGAASIYVNFFMGKSANGNALGAATSFLGGGSSASSAADGSSDVGSNVVGASAQSATAGANQNSARATMSKVETSAKKKTNNKSAGKSDKSDNKKKTSKTNKKNKKKKTTKKKKKKKKKANTKKDLKYRQTINLNGKL